MLEKEPEKILDILGNVCKIRGEQQLLSILESASIEIQTEEQDHGPSYHSIRLSIPFKLYIEIEDDKMNIESALSRCVVDFAEEHLDGYFTDLKVVSDISELGDWRSGVRPLQASNSDLSRLWRDGFFRLFLSHSSADKVLAANIREHLGRVRIDAFVAHEDLEPNIEWQQEIKLALASCHALLFISSERSNASVWCQQEVGWAMGRGLLVTSYKYPIPPQGFPAAKQGWSVPSHRLVELREKLHGILAKDDRTEAYIVEPLISLAESAKDGAQLVYALDQISKLRFVKQEHLARLKALHTRPYILSSQSASEHLAKCLEEHGYVDPLQQSQSTSEYNPFSDGGDYDPFGD